MNRELDILKNLFSHSAENVFILNYDFDILWYNKTELMNFFNGISLDELFIDETLPLKSNEYFFSYNGLEFSGKIINYSDMQIYILQMSGDDVVFSCMKCNSVREFLINQSAQVRQAVTGISFAGNILYKALEEAGMKEGVKYLNITTGNCYKLLKAIQNTSELIRYTDNTVEASPINLSFALESFTNICRGILKNQINISLKVVPGLYIKADSERLTSCLLSLTVLTGYHNPNCRTIMFSAERIGDYVSLTVAAGDSKDKKEQKVFSKFEKLYEKDISDSELLVVNCFCRTFGGTVIIADTPETGGKSYSLKFPFCHEREENATFSSPVHLYSDEKFSKYSIALSGIAEIY